MGGVKLLQLKRMIVCGFFCALGLSKRKIRNHLRREFRESASGIVISDPSSGPLVFIRSIIVSALICLCLFRFSGPLVATSSRFRVQ